MKRFNHERRIEICILIASMLAVVFTYKTPNFGWMGVYTLPNFPEITTGLPIFKPWIIIEKMDYRIFGNSMYLSKNISYAICTLLLLQLLILEAKSNHTTKKLYVLLPAILFILYFSADGGTLYDIIFTLSLMKSITIIMDRLENSRIKHSQVKTVFWLVILDLSRPIGIYFVIPLVLIALILKKFRSTVLTLLLFLVIILSHAFQYYKYETFIYSTYKGENLAEVFNGDRSRNCLEEFGRKLIDTAEFSDCSNQISREIINNLIETPAKLFHAFSFQRIKELFYPNPFWGKNPSPLDSQISIIFYSLLTFFYLYILINYRLDHKRYVATGIFLAGITFTLSAHNLTETIRVFMPYLMVLTWIGLQPSNSQ